MRLKSELWVKAYLRRAAVAGSPGVVVRRGDSDAGVIFKIARLDGRADLYGPSPAGLSSPDGERQWVLLADRAPEAEVEARLATELRLDSDIWIVEAEDRQGRHFLEGWFAAT